MMLQQANLSGGMCFRALRKFLLSSSSNSSSVSHGFKGIVSQTESLTPSKSSLPLRDVFSRQISSLITDYKQLSKFKLSTFVVLSASAGYVVGSNEGIDWSGLAWTSLGTFGAAACANTLNQLYEIRNDMCMKRTMKRPLPSGRLSPLHAALFAATLGSAGLAILYNQANPLTAALGAANIALYAGVYTPLKQITIANTWVGGLVGAIPPLMGWAGAAGTLEPGALILATALFFWQLPHFMALAWLCKDDYLRGGFKMVSGFDPSGRRTGLIALRNAIYLLPLGYAAHYLSAASQPFAWEAAALATMLAVPAARFQAKPTQANARKMFRYSLVYLPLLLVSFVFHREPNRHAVSFEDLQQKAADVLDSPALLRVKFLVEDTAFALKVTVSSAAAISSLISEMKCPSKAHCECEVEELKAAPGSKREVS